MPQKQRIYYAPWEKTFEKIATPFEEFIHRQTTTGILLITCAVVALIIANSPFVESYQHFLHATMAIKIGSWQIEHTLHHWVNDGLMTIFFFVVGLEIKREVLTGELSHIQNAILPVIAAIGGMVVPALFYIAINGEGAGAAGWGIPMATDIAFAVGVMALLGDRVPKSLLTFLVALAIVDDLGAVAVIALFYTNTINMEYVAVALVILAIMMSLNWMGFRRPLPYFVMTTLLWVAMEGSGIHATIAGILAAWTIPAYSRFDPKQFSVKVSELMDKFRDKQKEDTELVNNYEQSKIMWKLSHTMTLSMSPLQRLESSLHIPSTYIVIPIFALVNAAITLDTQTITDAAESSVAGGIMVGLILGKIVGVAGISILALKLGIGQLPKNTNIKHLIGAGMLAGIGFTMSIFIAGLAFPGNEVLIEQAKIGILAASLLAGLTGYAWLRWVAPSKHQPSITTAD